MDLKVKSTLSDIESKGSIRGKERLQKSGDQNANVKTIHLDVLPLFSYTDTQNQNVHVKINQLINFYGTIS